MRTTVTLDEDVAAELERMARERGVSFKEAINSVLRTGLGTSRMSARPYRVPARSLGLRPGLDLDRALRLASAMEDDETVRKLELKK